jgi:hypothetical protein
MIRIFQAALLGGLAAGVLDIVYAFIVYGPLSYGLSPLQVLQSVAGGWIGRDAAAAGGWHIAMLGLATHFAIAFVMALAFVLAAARSKLLTDRAILWGFLYGLVLYLVMNYIAVPLSAAATGQFPASAGEALQRLQESFSTLRPRYDPNFPWMIPATVFTHTVLVGVPIALAAKRVQQA